MPCVARGGYQPGHFVASCCIVLQCCSVLKCAACCIVLQRDAVRCSVLQCVAVCYSLLQFVAYPLHRWLQFKNIKKSLLGEFGLCEFVWEEFMFWVCFSSTLFPSSPSSNPLLLLYPSPFLPPLLLVRLMSCVFVYYNILRLIATHCNDPQTRHPRDGVQVNQVAEFWSFTTNNRFSGVKWSRMKDCSVGLTQER